MRNILFAMIALVSACASSDEPRETCGNGVLDGDESDLDCGGSCGVCAIGAACTTQSDCFDTSVDEARSCWFTPDGDAPECVLGFPSLAPDATYQELRYRCGGNYYVCDSRKVLWCYDGKWWTNGVCYY